MTLWELNVITNAYSRDGADAGVVYGAWECDIDGGRMRIRKLYERRE